MIKGIGLCVPHIYNPVEQEVMAGQFHAPSHPGVLKILKAGRPVGVWAVDFLCCCGDRGGLPVPTPERRGF